MTSFHLVGSPLIISSPPPPNKKFNREELVKSTNLSSELISYQIKSINNLIKKICGY